MKRLSLILLPVFCFPTPAVAQALFLNPVYDLPGNKGFEVVDRLGTDTARIWCDAARAARSRGVGVTERLYVTRGYGPSLSTPGIDGVAFSTRPSNSVLEAAASLKGPRTLSLTDVGNNMTVGQGTGYCVFEIDG
ncbi:hypothetical protein ACS3QZ_01150 [Shimia sp. W99]